MSTYKLTSSQARKRFYEILKRVGEGGDNFVVKVYKDAKIRIIREDLAEILEEIIGKDVWSEIHRILKKNRAVGEGTRGTIRKILKPKFRKSETL